jgi:hypothetical protein
MFDHKIYYSNGGFGPPPGGDRVGLGEIAFAAVPEPSTALLGGIALLFPARRRA